MPARFYFGGLVGGSLSIDVIGSKRGMVRKASAYQGVFGILPRLGERVVSVLIESKDSRGPMPLYDGERTEAEHHELIEMLRTIRGKAVLSGYPGEPYDSLG